MVVALVIAVGLATGACRAAGPPAVSTSSGGEFAASVGEELRALAVDTGDGSLVKATAQGLYRSPDGQMWTRLDVPGLSANASFTQVIVNPDDPAVLYAAGQGLGVIRSDDRGQTWRQASGNLPAQDVLALALHSFQRQTLFAWLPDKGVFQTKDGGSTWRRMDDGPESKQVALLVHSTLPGSMNTGWLYAATPGGAFISMDCF